MATRKSQKTDSQTASVQPDPPESGEPKMSALSAAARVLGEKGIAMTCPELIGVMAAKGYWSSPHGKTPAATLYAGIIKEIATRGAESRFQKTAPGRFAATDSRVTAAGANTPGPPVTPVTNRKRKKGKTAKATTAENAPDTAA